LSKALRIVAPFLLLVFLIYGLGKRHGPLPALANFLHPFHGVWVPPDDELKQLDKIAKIPGLFAPVTVKFDSNRIPHVFAQNDEDLYAVQGFLVAMDRLFQMEFMVRAGKGRLSEVLGKRTLDLDIMFNRLGMREASQESFELMQRDELTRKALDAYSRGVNAYIATLKDRDLPFEYKLLEVKPIAWEPVNSAVIQKVMAYNLTFWPQDLLLSRSRSRISEEDFHALFPVNPDVDEPIVPNDTKFTFTPTVPVAPATEFQTSTNAILPVPTPHPGNGSNNWAVGSKKSTTGYPIVSNDIHLSLQLPSYWYEIQLATPKTNAYGGTLPGAPGIIVGFNDKVSWAVTNGMDDITDWFELKFRDENKYEYLHGGIWRPVVARDREILVRDSTPVTITLRRTHFGPIVNEETETPVNPLIARGLAMRWGALTPSNELKTFLNLNRAKNFKECKQAIESYQTPSQNFICADQSGDYGIIHQGQLPVRWLGQGRLVSDGTDPIYDWNSGYISNDQLPKLVKPSRGYVLSANQPATGKDYPYYLPGMYDNSFRARRIKEMLDEKPKLSPEDLIHMQADSLIVVARDIVPTLVRNLPSDEKWTRLEQAALEEIKKWDYRAESDRSGAVIYDKWMANLVEEIWNDNFPNSKNYYYPRTQQTARLILDEPKSKWFDRIETDEVETLPILALRSFKKAIGELEDKLGGRAEEWQWGEYQPATFPHFAKFPGLEGKDRKTRGHAHAVFSNRSIHGPVWKTVVALGPEVKAWGVYPGGQSGNPISRYYDSFLDTWASGDLKKLEFLKSPDDKLEHELRSIEFTRAGAP
jgi:penicillin G amidase